MKILARYSTSLSAGLLSRKALFNLNQQDLECLKFPQKYHVAGHTQLESRSLDQPFANKNTKVLHVVLVGVIKAFLFLGQKY